MDENTKKTKRKRAESDNGLMIMSDRRISSHLTKFAIYPAGYRYGHGDAIPEPTNLAKLRRALTRRLTTLPPSYEDYSRFKDQAATFDDRDACEVIFRPELEGRHSGRIDSYWNLGFANLKPLTDGTIVQEKQVVCYASTRIALKRDVPKELNTYIVPSAHDMAVLPNFLVDFTGKDASPRQLETTIRHNAALAARGFMEVQRFLFKGSELDGKAYVLSASLAGDILRLYAHYPMTPNPLSEWNGDTEYGMVQLNAWVLSASLEDFCEGVMAYRNAVIWAEHVREEFIQKIDQLSIPLRPPFDLFNFDLG